MIEDGQELRRAEPDLAELLDPAQLEARLAEARTRRAEALAKRGQEKRSHRRPRVGEVVVSPTPAPLAEGPLEPARPAVPERTAFAAAPEALSGEFRQSTLPERLERSAWKKTAVESIEPEDTGQPEEQRHVLGTVLLFGFAVGVLGAIALWAPSMMRSWIQPPGASSSDRTEVATTAPDQQTKLHEPGLASGEGAPPALPAAVAERIKAASHQRGEVPAEQSLPRPWPPLDAALTLPGDATTTSAQANAAPETAATGATQPSVEAIPTRDLRVDPAPSPTEVALPDSPPALPGRTMPGGTSTASGLALARDALPDAPMFDGSPSLESIEVATATSSAAVPNWFGSLAAWARPPAAAPSDAELRFASIGDAAQLGYSLKSTSPSAPRPAVAPVSSERPRTTPARAAAPATERIRRAVRQVSAKPDAGEASKRAVLERTVENMLRDRLLSN